MSVVDIVEQIITSIERNNLIFFAGAGISVDPPSALPMARDVNQFVLESLFRDSEGILSDYYKRHYAFLNNEILHIKLESFFQIIFDILGDYTLDALQIFKQSEPNNIHLFIGELLKKRKIPYVFTTNFDSLIEKTLEGNGWVRDKDFEVHSIDSEFRIPEKPVIYKLHGTIEKSKSIKVIIDEIGKGLEDNKSYVLNRLLERSEFLFLGYSNYDLDISVLLRNGTKRFFWINHESNRNEPETWKVQTHDGLKLSQDEIDRLLLIHKGTRIFCNTMKLLEHLASKLGINLPTFSEIPYPTSKRNLQKLFSRWAEGVDDDEKFLIIAEMLDLIGRWEDAIQFFKKGFELRKRAGQEENAIWVYQRIGEIYERQGELDLAMKNYQKSQEDFKAFKKQYDFQRSLLSIGDIYLRKGEYGKAKRCFKSVEKVVEAAGNTEDMLSTYDRLSNLYTQQEQWDKALAYSRKVLELSEKHGILDGMTSAYNNLGLIYHLLNRYDKSIESIAKALEILEKAGPPEDLATAYNNMGTAYYYREKDENDIKQAIECFKNALSISKKIQDAYGIAITYHNLGVIHSYIYEEEKAIEFIEKSIKILERIGDLIGLIESYSLLGEIYKEINQEAKGEKCFSKVKELKKESCRKVN